MTKEERLQKQRERLAEMKLLEAELHDAGYKYVAGVDEVGRGPLAGPVVTAAVVLPKDFEVLGVDDSKKISEKTREKLYDIILEKAVAYGIGMADHETIDEINILQATELAMKRAVAACEKMLCESVVQEESEAQDENGGAQDENSGTQDENSEAQDENSEAQYGNAVQGGIASRAVKLDFVLLDAMTIEELNRPQRAVVKGDTKVLAIAAASIVAKVTRDRMMVEYAKEYPWYAFERNKGYGTAAHYAGIREHGICPIHRRTFLKKIH